MSLRTFHNLVEGRNRKQKAEMHRESIRDAEMRLTFLAPHMKKSDWEKAYKEVERAAKGLVSEKSEKTKKEDPREFWKKIDEKARRAKEPPIPEG